MLMITIKDNSTKPISIPYNLSFSYKDRRSNKVNSISFIKPFQTIISLLFVGNSKFVVDNGD